MLIHKTPSQPRNWDLPALESVMFLLLGSCEVVTKKLDSKNLLKAYHHFALSLDVHSEEFKNDMGSSWSGVTLNVLLRNSEGMSFRQRMLGWVLYHIYWNWHKKYIFKGNKKN